MDLSTIFIAIFFGGMGIIFIIAVITLVVFLIMEMIKEIKKIY